MIKLNKNILLGVVLLCASFFFAGCGGAATNNTTTSNTANNAAKPAETTKTTTSTDPAKTDTTKTDATTSGDKVGVPECDEYIEKYEACLTKITEKSPQTVPAMKTAFEQQREAFKKSASTPEGKAALATQCKSLIESSKQSYSAYGCSW